MIKELTISAGFLLIGDTVKFLRPVVEIEPRITDTQEFVRITAKYNFNKIDTANWDYYLFYDFISKDRFLQKESLPFEQHKEKIEGNTIEKSIGFLEPGEIAMYGRTLGIHRETGDSIFHLEIKNQFLTVKDTTSVGL